MTSKKQPEKNKVKKLLQLQPLKCEQLKGISGGLLPGTGLFGHYVEGEA